MEAYFGLLAFIALPTLGVMVLVWFRQITKLFDYLKNNYPAEYKSIGEPSLIMNNTPKNNIAFLRFIQGSRPAELGDEKLINWCKFLTKFFYAYMFIFAGFIITIMVSANAS
ncbi:hypothetical protein O0V09_18840 [Dasania sp. GY-19]|uniref:Uncharacterized protein n=1 Tax=Dasania phycosphaerae TaxID=2950436 RepID=A0A9J6RRP8_9GAMM|nr:hypothetical protein [Dasania phycosphaerae]MCZ0867259.1 hypothetical protein [Dasania phycosphaerae]